MWYQFWPPSRAVRAILALWRWWLFTLCVTTVASMVPIGELSVADLTADRVALPFTNGLPLRFLLHLRLWALLAVLLTSIVVFCEGCSRGLPRHLGVFGKLTDQNPWRYDEDAATFADGIMHLEWMSSAEVVRLQHGAAGTFVAQEPVNRIWSHQHAHCLVVGTARTGGGFSLQHVPFSLVCFLREALLNDRVAVLELRSAKKVYLFEPTWDITAFKCRAWRVDCGRWAESACAVLRNPSSVYLVDVDRHEDGFPFCAPCTTFMSKSLSASHGHRWAKEGSDIDCIGAAGPAELADSDLELRRRFAGCEGKRTACFDLHFPLLLCFVTHTLSPSLPLLDVYLLAGCVGMLSASARGRPSAVHCCHVAAACHFICYQLKGWSMLSSCTS
jgi:hypothetical protein